MKKRQELPIYLYCLGGGVSACVAEASTLPLDTAKVRLQIQGATKAVGGSPYTGMFNTIVRISREEGVLSLWKGLGPGCLRQMVFAGLRLGLYEPTRNFISGPSRRATFVERLATGLLTGAFAISCAQPTDLLKIRLQAEGRLSPGAVRRYPGGMLDSFIRIAKADGIRGLWTGLGPNICRNSVINCAELVSYDMLKELILDRKLMGDHIGTHIAAGLGAGFMGTVIGSPFDVMKTRIMNKTLGPDGKPLYRGLLHCFGKIFRTEGPLAFYQGFMPNFMRIGCFNVVVFIVFEKVKKQMNIMYNRE